MPNNKKIGLNDRITSTSEFTVGDIVNAVAKHLGTGTSREHIEEIVKDVVRPCAIDNGTGGTVTPLTARVCVGGVSSGICARVSTGNGPCAGIPAGIGGCPGAGTPRPCEVGVGVDMSDVITRNPDAKGSPRFAVNSRYYNTVLQNGEVWSPYTNRRFLPAQYLSLMEFYHGNVDAGIARRYNLRECFRLLDTEIEKLIFMAKHWKTAYCERSQFLTVSDCCTIFNEYLRGLRDNINDRGKCTFNDKKGEYRRRIQGEGSVILWTEHKTHSDGANGQSTDVKTIEPTPWLISLNAKIEFALKRVAKCHTYEVALDILRNDMPHVSMGTFRDSENCIRYWLPKRWKECFKKQGAYYTLKSLIVNKHVMFTTETGNWRNKTTHSCRTAREGLDKLATLLPGTVPAYVVHAILKKSIENSGLNISKFLRSITRR